MKRDRMKRDQMKRNIVLALLLLLLMLLIAGAGLGYTAWRVYDTMDDIYRPVERLPSPVRPAEPGKTPSAQPEQQQLHGETILLLGLDRREGAVDTGRTDVILPLVWNPETQSITLASIPRDTYVEIAGQGYSDKINHSYQHGVETTIATVESFLGLPVDHYILFDFRGFVKAVDAVGGVTLDVDPAVAQSLKLEPGTHRLTGEQALQYARFRNDERGDFGRNDRQQTVLKAYLDQTRGVRSPGMIRELLQVVGEDVRTDISATDMATLALAMKDVSGGQVEQVRYEGRGSVTGPQNVYYFQVSEAERQRVTQLLRDKIAAK